MPKGKAKAPSQRQLKVGEELRHALAWMLERGEVHDPAVAATPLTVTEVAVSPDLKNATAYIVPLGGGDANMDEILAGLGRASPFLRRRMVEQVRLRYAPRLSFAADTTFEYAGHIDALLRRPDVARDLAEHAPPESDDAAAEPTDGPADRSGNVRGDGPGSGPGNGA